MQVTLVSGETHKKNRKCNRGLRKKIAANLEPSLDLSGIGIGDLVGWWVVGSVDGTGLSVDSGE